MALVGMAASAMADVKTATYSYPLTAEGEVGPETITYEIKWDTKNASYKEAIAVKFNYSYQHTILSNVTYKGVEYPVTTIKTYTDPDYMDKGKDTLGSIYYDLDLINKVATVVSGNWQYIGTVVIPEEVEFNGESYLVTTIGKNAFYCCYDLDEVVLGANVETIKQGAFYRCGQSGEKSNGVWIVNPHRIKINLNSPALKVIETNGIQETQIMPNKGDTLILGKNIERLGPESETSMDNWYSWGARYGVKFYKVEAGNTHFSNDNKGVLYNSTKTTLIAYPPASTETTFEIPSSVITVRHYAFDNISNLKTVTGGVNVESIGSVIRGSITRFPVGAKVKNMATTAFMYADKAFLPVVDENNPRFKFDGNALYDYKYTVKNDPNTYICLCRFFRHNSSITTFKIPANVTYIGPYAFYSHPYIKYVDFEDCTGLKSSKIDGTAFHSTSNSVEFLNADNIFYKDEYGVVYSEDTLSMMIYGSNVTAPDYIMPTETKTIPVSAIKDNSYVRTFAVNNVCNSINTEYLYNMSVLERYSVPDGPDGNKTYSTDTCGVLYNNAKTTLLSYPRGNKRVYYRVDSSTTQINVKAFFKNQYLIALDLCSNIQSVMNGNNSTLASMSKLQAIKVSTMDPPTVSTSSFSNDMITNGTIKLYVPTGKIPDGNGGYVYDKTKDATGIYLNTSVWNRFYVIQDTCSFESDIHNIEVKYSVEHYQQNLNGDGYTKIQTNPMTGKLLGTTEAKIATDGDFASFDPQPFSQITLSNTGMAVKIYYNRKHYTITWKNGDDILYTDNYRFGADFLNDTTKFARPTSSDAGKHFVGWNSDPSATVAITFNGNERAHENITYYAIFAANTDKPYVVEHYQENLDGTYPTEPTNTDNGSGAFGSLTTASPRNYAGFTSKEFDQLPIAEDGSTVIRIEYKRNTHSLVWHGNNGNLDGDYTSGNEIKFGTTIVEPIATREGYDFFGWNTSDDPNATVATPTSMPDYDLEYYAVWQVKQYQAIFYLNNGTNETWVEPFINFGETITRPAGNPLPENYDNHHDFIGWSDSPTGTVLTGNDFGKMTVNGAKFYAIWQLHSNTLTWEPNGGVLTGIYTSGEVEYDAEIIKPNDPTRDGYTFMGWATSQNGTPSFNVSATMPDADLTYYAIWQINQHTITWNANGGEIDTEGTNGTFDYGTPITPATTKSRIGYDFIGWNTQAEATTAIDVATTMPDNDLTYYAIWKVHTHTLTWNANGGYFVNENTSGDYDFGAAITIPQVNRDGWKCAGWGYSPDATPDDVVTPVATMPDSDLTYYTIWITRDDNIVTWKMNDGTDFNYTATNVTTNEIITAPAGTPERDHYQFIGWAASPDGEVLTDFGRMNESKKEFYAQWELNSHKLTWNANGGEIVTAGTSGDNVAYGTPIKIATAERTGYSFVGWGLTADATENDAVRITNMPDNDVEYFAIWATNTYDVKWLFNNGTGECFAVTQVSFDAKIQAPNSNPARVHYDFIGWAATPQGVIISDFGVLTTPGAIYYAQWQVRKFTLGWDANGGELSGDYTQAGEVEYGTPIVAPTATLANHIFAGWGTSVNRDLIVNVTTMPDSSVTYVANWITTEYAVEWRMNDGTSNNYTATHVDFEDDIIAPEVNPERVYYQFLGWSDSADGDVITEFGKMDSDHKIFYAQWQINSHTLAWNANGGELSGDYTQGSVEYGTEIVRPIAEREGYTFDGWNTYAEAVDSIEISTMPDNDIEYFAIWKVNKYTIAWNMNNGTDSVFATTNINYADTIKAPQAQPERTDYWFKGWSATETGQAIDSFGLMPATNIAFYAVWEASLYEAIWMVNNGTDAIFATTQASANTTLVAPDSIPQRENYTFIGWSTSANGSPMNDIEMPEGGITLYAVWKPNQFTAIWKMNDGTDNNFETVNVEMGQPITVPTKTPTRQYYNFVGWSKTAQGAVTTDFGTMTANGAEFFAIWDAIVEFTAPESFVTCEREQIIELSDLSNKEIVFSWNVNGKVDTLQTGSTFDIPDDAAFNGTITVTGSFGGKDVVKSITYQRKKMMTRTLWDDVITVVNPNTAFASYRWYHNDVLVDTTEYYNEVGGLTGKYYLVATTQSGVEICSCESDFGSTPEATMTVYPNPTVDDITVAGSLIETGATISVIDGNGKEWLRKTVETDGSETIRVSQMPQGMYIVKVGGKVVSFIKL